MLLNNLTEKNKERFWELVNFIIASDGEVTTNELKMINEYAIEMNYFQEIKTIPIDKATQVLNDLLTEDKSQKRIIFMELLALAYADDKFSVEEQSFMKNCAKKFDIKEYEIEKLEQSIHELQRIYKNINEFIK